MTGHEQTEIERKYDVEGLRPVPSLRDVFGVSAETAQEPVILSAVYYDTDDNALARNRIVLRRREGGGDAGWHLKKPANEGRTEVHWPLDLDTETSESDPVPADVLESVRAIVRDRPLTPLARISTVRTTVRLAGADGQLLAEIADDLVSASDARGGTYRKWREWEAELLDGAPDTRKKRTRLLDSIEQALLAAGATPSTSVAKIARAVGVESLTELSAPEVMPGLLPAAALQRPDSAGAIVVGAVRQLTATLIANDPLARADAPDAVHQMRTAIRRLRSVLAVYARLFEKTAVKELRLELGRLGVELGRARDAEVRGARLAGELAGIADYATEYPTNDAHTRLVGGARRDYAEGLESVRSYLLSARYYRLLDSLDSFAAWPPLTDKAQRPAATEITRDLHKAVGVLAHRTGAVSDADAPEQALHEVRKAARRLRYAADAVAAVEPAAEPVAGTPVTKKQAAKRKKAAAEFATTRRGYAHLAKTAKPLVKRLGDRHDGLLYIQELDQAAQAAHESGENTLVYGLLVARAERLDDTVPLVLGEANRVVRALERRIRDL